MIFIFLTIALAIAAGYSFTLLKHKFKRQIGFGLSFISLFVLISTSCVFVDANNIAVLNRIYFADTLPAGRVMMYEEGKTYKGPQAKYLTEGFHFSLFIRVLNDIDEEPLVTVEEGTYAVLIAKDGKTLPKGAFMAPEWKLSADTMLRPDQFLINGGYKGTQLTVLRPGRYPIHPDLWDYKIGKALVVKTGEVAVIRSNVQTDESLKCESVKVEGQSDGNLSSPLVPNGCKGVWEKPLGPGSYYMNGLAFVSTTQTTRAVAWKYKGGYDRREINLVVNDDGTISQKETSDEISQLKNYADGAIIIRTADGWTIPVEVRITAQVYRNDASRVIAGVGSMDAVEDRIATPAVRDIVRQIGGTTKASELVSKRAAIVEQIEKVVIPEAAKAGVTVQEISLDEIVLPPELLLPQRRKQLASSLKLTYAEEKLAADERAKSEKAIAIANQQSTLVEADMGAQAAKLRGEGERDRLIELAKGQKAQISVIGKKDTVMLQMFNDFLNAAKEKPEIIKVPVISVQSGEQGSLEGFGAVLGGSSNIAQFTSMANK